MKLVRDKIPKICMDTGMTIKAYREMDEDARKQRLIDKLHEETIEFLDSFDIEEAADILEVMSAMCGCLPQDIMQAAAKKWNDKGGFREFVIMEVINDEEK
jgi:predicted house-cleaning noncanonical NTP pyrophosphatase (MazG superfamily)